MNFPIQIDWQEFNPKYGLVFAVYLMIAWGTTHLFLAPGLIASLALLFAGLLAFFVPAAQVKVQLLIFLILGLLVTASALLFVKTPLASVLFVFCACLLLPIIEQDAFSKLTSLLLQAWAMIATLLAAAQLSLTPTVIAFEIGVFIPLAWCLLSGSFPGEKQQDTKPVPFRWQPSNINLFAFLRALFIVFAIYIGQIYFPEFPLWTGLTVLIVLQIDVEQTFIKSTHRALGTFLGVVLVLLIITAFGRSTVILTSVLLISGFMMLACLKMHYALVVIFVTTFVVAIQGLVERDSFDVGWTRLLATIFGIFIAMVLIFVARSFQLDRK